MLAAIISLISALAVAVIAQWGQFYRDKKNRNYDREDKQQEKHDELLAAINGLSDKVNALDNRLDKHYAVQSRVRILRFSDEIYCRQKHSQEHFKQILEDIDIYEAFCDKNPGFRNGVARHAIDHIKAIYEDADKENDFLK